MVFDKQVKVLKTVFVADGMGGGKDVVVSDREIECNIPPYEITTQKAGGREVDVFAITVFTQDEISPKEDLLEYEGKRYKMVSYTNYGKVITFDMEVEK